MKRNKATQVESAFRTYTLGRGIGEGGSGRVHEASDDSGGVHAIKLLHPKLATSEKRKRFQNEIQFCSRHEHSHVIRVIDSGLYSSESSNAPFYVMPLYSSSLRELLKHGIQHDQVLQLFKQILDGVETAHFHKVIHRDLKPENILYDAQGKRLVVADFGIAHFEEDELYTAVKTRGHDRMANFQYAAPEQRTPGRSVDYRADIFALGFILNEMFTGNAPHGTRYRTVADAAPQYAYLDELVATMISQEPGERPSSIAKVKDELIARGNDFVHQQRLSALKRTVVVDSDIDDPLVVNPIELVRADYDSGTLILYLSQPINDLWGHAFRNFGGYESMAGKGPDAFRLQGNEGRIGVGEHDADGVLRYFQLWLPRVNQRYTELVHSQKKKELDRQRQELQRRVEEEEKRKRILGEAQTLGDLRRSDTVMTLANRAAVGQNATASNHGVGA